MSATRRSRTVGAFVIALVLFPVVAALAHANLSMAFPIIGVGTATVAAVVALVPARRHGGWGYLAMLGGLAVGWTAVSWSLTGRLGASSLRDLWSFSLIYLLPPATLGYGLVLGLRRWGDRERARASAPHADQDPYINS